LRNCWALFCISFWGRSRAPRRAATKAGQGSPRAAGRSPALIAVMLRRHSCDHWGAGRAANRAGSTRPPLSPVVTEAAGLVFAGARPPGPSRHRRNSRARRPVCGRSRSGIIILGRPFSYRSSASGRTWYISGSTGLGQKRRAAGPTHRGAESQRPPARAPVGPAAAGLASAVHALAHGAAAGSSSARAKNSIRQPGCST